MDILFFVVRDEDGIYVKPVCLVADVSTWYTGIRHNRFDIMKDYSEMHDEPFRLELLDDFNLNYLDNKYDSAKFWGLALKKPSFMKYLESLYIGYSTVTNVINGRTPHASKSFEKFYFTEKMED